MHRGEDRSWRGRGPSPRGDESSPVEPRREREVLVFSRGAVRELDRLAEAEYGVPPIVLMENAARGVCEAVLDELDELGEGAGGVLIVCGGGNNGGDGLAAARLLSNEGVPVSVAMASTGSRLSAEAETNLRIVRAMRLPVLWLNSEDPVGGLRAAAMLIGGRIGVVIDAVLGTGVQEQVRQPLAGVIGAINALRGGGRGEGPVIVSVDVPSGLDAETGRPLGLPEAPAVRADVTVTFVGLKAGFLTLESQPFLGRVRIADIGAPWELARRLGAPLRSERHRGEDAEQVKRFSARGRGARFGMPEGGD